MSDEEKKIDDEIAELQKKKAKLQQDEKRDKFVNKHLDALRKTMEANNLPMYGDLGCYREGFLFDIAEHLKYMSMDGVDKSLVEYELNEQFDKLAERVNSDIDDLKGLKKRIKDNRKNIVKVAVKRFKTR